MRLSELKIGSLGRIQKIEDSPFTEKLMEMGCVPGSLIRPLFKAPFGDPVAYEVEEYTLSIRSAEAAFIQVQPLGDFF